MNQPIKFRAWDSDSKQMLSPEFVGQHWNVADLDGESDFPVMQFTGLSDKNGKEIYEGDILINDGCDTPEVIKFKDGGFYGESGVDARLNMNVGYYTKEAKVIGNIYENPDLIK